MSKRDDDRKLIWRVMNEAWENVSGLIDAYSHMPPGPETADARALLERIDEYAVRKYGKAISARRKETEPKGTISLYDAIKQTADKEPKP